jgi:hypothetical protein
LELKTHGEQNSIRTGPPGKQSSLLRAMSTNGPPGAPHDSRGADALSASPQCWKSGKISSAQRRGLLLKPPGKGFQGTAGTPPDASSSGSTIRKRTTARMERDILKRIFASGTALPLQDPVTVIRE